MFVYYKCYDSIEVTFLKKMILTKQVHQMNVISLSFIQLSAIHDIYEP